MSAESHRLFFALWPDEDTAAHLHALAHDLNTHAQAPGRVSAAHNVHLTTAFIGSVDTPMLDAVIDAASELVLPALTIEHDHLGFWPGGGVVYAGVRKHASSPDAANLKAIMDASAGVLDHLGIARDARAPVPHVTLARGVRGIKLPRLAIESWHADEWVLARSSVKPGGASYEIVARWPLQPSDEADDDDSDAAFRHHAGHQCSPSCRHSH
jgi:RNA 2',3'-cyclic 3'-phosphodiesterase